MEMNGAGVSKDRALIAFAFLADELTRGHDLATSILPLFKPVTKPLAGKRFSPKQLSQLISDCYGMDIHPYAIEDLVPRLEAAGILTRNPATQNIDELIYANISEDFDAVEDSFSENLFTAFESFAAPVLQLHKISLSSDQLRSELLARLRRTEFLGILAKPDRTREDERSPSTIGIKKSADEVAWELDVTAQAHMDVLVASFFLDTKNRNPPLFEMLLRTAAGVVVSEVVLNFRNPHNLLSLNGLVVILDTPFLMSMLDLASEVRHEYSKRLATQLIEKGAVLATFRHCVDEFRDNLKAVLSNFERGEAYGETAGRLRQLQFRTYAATLTTSIEPRLRELGVQVVSEPTAPMYRHFPDTDVDELRRKITFHERWLARDRDAHSITNVIRLRSGKYVDFDHLGNAGYVFLSENAKLVNLATGHLVASKIYNERDVPPCLTDRYFAGLLWIMFGGENNSLTEFRLLANCVRAIQPRRDVIAKMNKILSGLDGDKAKHFSAIMTTERGSHYLMQQTLGDSLLITEDNAEDIYQQLEFVVGERVAREKDEEIRRLADEHALKQREQASLFEGKLADIEDTYQKDRQALEERLQTSVSGLHGQVAELRDYSADSMRKAAEAKASAAILSADLERERQARISLEFGLVSRAMKKATKGRKLYISLVIFGLLTVFIGLNLVDKFVLSSLPSGSLAEAMGLPIYIGGQAVLFLVSLWFVPDTLFGRKAKNRQVQIFENELSLHRISNWNSRYTIDWKSGSVSLTELSDREKEPDKQPE